MLKFVYDIHWFPVLKSKRVQNFLPTSPNPSKSDLSIKMLDRGRFSNGGRGSIKHYRRRSIRSTHPHDCSDGDAGSPTSDGTIEQWGKIMVVVKRRLLKESGDKNFALNSNSPLLI